MKHQTSAAVKSPFLRIIYVGILVGTFDILAALIDYYFSTGKNPLVIFEFIASGILGTKAFNGGPAVLLLGLLLHFMIALIFTFFFWLLFSRMKLLVQHKLLKGFIYGILVWTTMNFIVLPISLAPKTPFNLAQAIKGVVIIIAMIGLPTSLLMNRQLKQK